MKNKLTFILALLILLMTGFMLSDSGNNGSVIPLPEMERQGTAIIMTGAAARIPQEAALLEELYNRGKLKDIVFISGVSSGALNAVMLNGILSGKMSWNEYRKILFSLKNSDIYIQNGKKLPVDTEPARKLYKMVVEERLGYYRIGDLPYMTAISFTNLKNLVLKKRVYRMCSRKINEESDTTLSLVDIMMASSSFPVAFPPVRIKNVTTIPDVEYIDGGVGDDHVPYQALLDFEKFSGKGVERVYIISRKSDSIPEVGKELADLGLKDRKIYDKIGVSLENLLKKDIIKRLMAFESEAPELAGRTYIWIPDFSKDFFLLNFNNLQEQYIITQEWARTHNPVPLEKYLLPYKKDERNLSRLMLRPFPRQ